MTDRNLDVIAESFNTSQSIISLANVECPNGGNAAGD
jgi:hypothetical protein